MKKWNSFFTVCFFFISISVLHSQNVVLNSQTDLDNFDPSTTTINGHLVLDDDYNNTTPPIVDLSNLANITSIQGNLKIYECNSLTNIDAFLSLQSVGGKLIINRCHNLTNLDGFSGLLSISGDLRIGENDYYDGNHGLLNLDGLSNITDIGGNLRIVRNYHLTHLDGFSNLATIGGNLLIEDSDSLVHINGFPNLISVQGDFQIGDEDHWPIENHVVSHIGGFTSLSNIGGSLRIFNNDSMQHIDGLSSLTSVGGDVYLRGNTALTNVDGLSSLTSTGGDVNLRGNTALTNVDGFSSLSSIGTSLLIEYNHALEDVDGFFNVSSIGGGISVTYNNSITNLDGFSNIINVDVNIVGINIRENSQLLNLDGLSNMASGNNLSINIDDNNSITNLDFLSNTTTLYSLDISDNNSLTNLSGLQNLVSVSDRLALRYLNSSITNLDFLPNLTSLGRLEIWDTRFTNLDGLSNVSIVDGGQLRILFNYNLQEIDGLSNMTASLNRLDILYNQNLQNLDGLSNITASEYVEVKENPNLIDCCGIDAVLNSLNTTSVNIYDNPFPCNNESEIISSCNDTTLLYVDASAQGNNVGSSWANAFTNLQDALTIGAGKKIHIAEGTYLPTTDGFRGKSFIIPNETTLIGGYSTDGGNQDAELYETILSGNIDASSINGDSYHVVTINNVDNVELKGLTIRDGNANDASSFGRSRGGGIYIINSTVELKDVNIKWNKGVRGGGLFASESSVTIRTSTIKNNRADYGSGLFYTLGTDLDLLRSQVVDNTSNNRCALESNNASSTTIKNSIIANNASSNANAIGIIATTRNVTVQILNSTIIGGSNHKNLITYQVGNNDQLDVTINNSIIAHQNPSFNKSMIAYNFNILNLNHNNCYFSGSSTIGNGTNDLYADSSGDMLLNADYSIANCSPLVDAGNDALGTGSQDYFGNSRYFNTIDIGAYESQVVCRESGVQDSEELEIQLFPNPITDDFTLEIKGEEVLGIKIYDALSRRIYKGSIQGQLRVNTENWTNGMYYLVLLDDKGEVRGSRKIVKSE